VLIYDFSVYYLSGKTVGGAGVTRNGYIKVE
jgi:hypothetical protein